RTEVEKRLAALKEGLTTTPPSPGQGGAASSRAETVPAGKAAGPSATFATGEAAVSPYRTAAWTGVAVTVAVLTAGAVLGLAAQSRADEIERRGGLINMGQQPAVYDDTQRDAWNALVSD